MSDRSARTVPGAPLRAACAMSTLEARLLFAASDYYAIKVVDGATGRGVPQVDLVMTDGKRYTTDSGGTVAFNRSGSMNTADAFVVETYGYKLASGTAVTLTPVLGQSGTVTLARTQSAERAYRETGVNKFAQTVAVGGASPVAYPGTGAPGNVFGQDSGLTAVYKGKLYEFWGDTGRDLNNDGKDDGAYAAKYHTTGGIIDLPANGGVDPAQGENINYLLNSDGTLKEMFPTANGFNGPLVWASSPMVTQDANGNEKMVIGFSSINGLGQATQSGFAVWNDTTQQFTVASTYTPNPPVAPGQNAVLTSFNGVSYYVIPNGSSFLRVKNTYADLTNINGYEVYTPLKAGRVLAKDTFLGLTHVIAKADINYDAGGNVVWSWQPNTTVLNGFDYDNLNTNGYVPTAQNPFKFFKDVDGSGTVSFSSSALAYNDYLKSWTLIGQQTFGTSAFGEIWYASAKSLTGPWTLSRKIQTNSQTNGVNDAYTFYNLIQHPEYSRDGKYLYYEGTNTAFLVDGGFRGEYFKNADFTGYAYKDNQDTVNFNYAAKSPNAALVPNADNFSARFTGTLTYPTGGTYQFRITTDAGAKLTLGTNAAINQLAGTTQATYTSGNITASANATTGIEVLYDSLASTAANVKLEWLTPGSATWAVVPGSAIKHDPAEPQDNYNTFMYRLDLTNAKVSGLDAGTGLTAQVFDNADFTNYKGTLGNQGLNGAWADGTSPLAGVAATSYSVRYLGLIRPTYGETYTFTATSDEGVRVWVDGQLLINNWPGHAATADTGRIALQAGRKYDVRVEYYNGTGAGQLKLEWASASQARQVVPASALYPATAGFRTTYFDDTALTTAKTDTVSSLINLSTPYSSVTTANPGTPDPSGVVNDGQWSARWTAQLRPDYTGTYAIGGTSDDGMRIWVNGVKLVDAWNNQSDTTRRGTIDLVAGQYYDIVVEYYNAFYTSTAKVFWNNARQTGGVDQLIPQENVLAGPATVGGTATTNATFVGSSLFYNDSAYDGNDAAADAADDAAIATDKSPLLPGNTATFANYGSYDKGINGVMIDVADLPATAVLSGADFDFLVGNGTSTAGFTAAPAPASVAVRRGAGANGSDRVEVTWADGSVVGKWLQITVHADANTGLLYPATFAYGNAPGETGDTAANAIVNATDAVGANNNPASPFNPAAVTNVYDFNRDRLVNATDAVLASNDSTSPFTALSLLPLSSDASTPAAGTVAMAAVQKATGTPTKKTTAPAAPAKATRVVKPAVAVKTPVRPVPPSPLASKELIKDLPS